MPAAAPLNVYIRLESLLHVFTLDSTVPIVSVFPVPDTLRHIPGAPRQGRLVLRTSHSSSEVASILSFVVFPFADMLLSLLKGFGCIVHLFTPHFSTTAAREVVAAAGWSSACHVISVRGDGEDVVRSNAMTHFNLRSCVRVLNTVHLGVTADNWASFVILDVPAASAATTAHSSEVKVEGEYVWSSSLAPYVIEVNHCAVVAAICTLREAVCSRVVTLSHLSGSDDQRGSRPSSSSAKRQEALSVQRQARAAAASSAGQAAQQRIVHALRRSVRASLVTLGLLPVLHKCVRLFELFVSGVATSAGSSPLPCGDVRGAIQLAETSLFRGSTFHVVSSPAPPSLESTLTNCNEGRSAALYLTWRATELGLLLREYGAHVNMGATPDDTLAESVGWGSDCCYAFSISLPFDAQDDEDDSTNNAFEASMLPRPHVGTTFTAGAIPRCMTNEQWIAASIDAWCVLPRHPTLYPVASSLDDLVLMLHNKDGGTSPQSPTKVEESELASETRQDFTKATTDDVDTAEGALLQPTTFAYDRVPKVHEYIAAHMMLMLAPPRDCVVAGAPVGLQGGEAELLVPPFSRQCLHSMLVEVHVSSLPLEDPSFVAMVQQELELVIETSGVADTQVRLDDDVNEENAAAQAEMQPERAGPSHLFSGFYSKRRVGDGHGLELHPPIAPIPKAMLDQSAAVHAQRILAMLDHDMRKAVTRPPSSCAATQTWVQRKASTGTMTTMVTTSPPVTTAAAAATLSSSGKPSSLQTKVATPDEKVKPPPSKKVHQIEQVQSSNTVKHNQQPLPEYVRGGVGGVVSRGGDVSADKDKPSAAAFGHSPGLAARSATVAPIPIDDGVRDHSYIAPKPHQAQYHHKDSSRDHQQQLPPPSARHDEPLRDAVASLLPPPSDYRCHGMVPLASVVAELPAGGGGDTAAFIGYTITGMSVPDFMTVELPLYAYGLQMESKTPLKTLKGLIVCDKRKLEGVSVQLLPAPDWFVSDAPRATAPGAGWFTLLLSFATDSDARLFVGENAFATLNGRVKKVFQLLEGEQLTRVAATGRRDTTSSAPPRSNDRQRTNSPIGDARSSQKRARSPPAEVDYHRQHAAPPPHRHPVTTLAGLLTSDEIDVLGSVGSSVQQLLDDPRRLEIHSHENLKAYPREQQLVLSAVRKALSVQQDHPPAPAQGMHHNLHQWQR